MINKKTIPTVNFVRIENFMIVVLVVIKDLIVQSQYKSII